MRNDDSTVCFVLLYSEAAGWLRVAGSNPKPTSVFSSVHSFDFDRQQQIDGILRTASSR
jgi:hypothetical protein